MWEKFSNLFSGSDENTPATGFGIQQSDTSTPNWFWGSNQPTQGFGVQQAVAPVRGFGFEQSYNAMNSPSSSISSGASVAEIDKMIQMESHKQQERIAQQQQREQELQQEMRKMQMDMMKYQSDLRIEEVIAKEDAKKETTLEKAEIDAQVFALQQDIDNNKVNDDLQAIDKEWSYKLPLEKEKLEIERMKAKSKPSK